MTSTVTAFDRPRSFVEQQTRGPFRSFRHEHRFRGHPAGTTMTDSITFEAPFGVIGRLVEPFLGRYLTRLLRARNRLIAKRAVGR